MVPSRSVRGEADKAVLGARSLSLPSFLILTILTSRSVLIGQELPIVEDLVNVEKLSARVLLVKTGEQYPDQVAAVNSEKGIVLIDSGISPSLSRKYRVVLRHELRRDDYAFIINTHHHFDHTNGNQVFSDGTIIAHENFPVQMREFAFGIPEFVKTRRARYQRRWKLAQNYRPDSALFKRLRDLAVTSSFMCNDLENDFILTLPSLTFSDRLTIKLGDMTLKLFYFRGGLHTNNDVIAVIPEEGIVFTGDLFFDTEIRSVILSTHPLSGWIESLEMILSEVPELKHVVTIHQGVLSPESLATVLDTMIAMREEREDRANGTTILERLLSEGSLSTSLRRFEDVRRSSSYYFWEADLTELGNRLVSDSQIPEAVSVFELAAEMFPESVSAKYFLADGYNASGEVSKAIKTLEEALQLDPVSSYAIDRINQLQKDDQ